ncbi:non-specific lipid-transfer protein 2-like [Vicia villosa]|uniref:non-specific lipid-transfer protein 2-like n=1 Tax=Vicia villosa TaxID=3911 RepID=UPI00273C3CC8|nr:non-specific lipid-transfer protein 2-like [Vicia villosa]
MARSMKLACVVLVMCMVVIAPMAEGDISCADVIKEFSSCLTYLEAPDNASPSTQCCGGVKKLLDAATTTADRQAACKCLKSAAGSISKLNTNNAAALPGKCGVSIPYKISTSTNCNTIKF